jgi:hypothetical protein
MNGMYHGEREGKVKKVESEKDFRLLIDDISSNALDSVKAGLLETHISQPSIDMKNRSPPKNEKSSRRRISRALSRLVNAGCPVSALA